MGVSVRVLCREMDNSAGAGGDGDGDGDGGVG
jgi:hypothetical protein